MTGEHDMTAVRSGDDVSILRIVTPLVHRWRFVAGLALGLAVLAAVWSLIVPPTYAGRTTFTPETAGSSSLPAGLAGAASLAGQLGISLGNANGPNAEFFVEVLKSREVLIQTLNSTFRPDTIQPARPLLDILEITGRTPEARIEMGIRKFGSQVAASVDRRTGIVTLVVKHRSPVLAAQVANRMVEILDEFNQKRRQSQSREQKRFVGERLQATENELRRAEDVQLRFLQANRQYQQSPLLVHEFNRLQRDVDAKQAVYLTLTRAFEEARVAEVRDTPLLTVIDHADPPVFRVAPRRKVMVLVAAALGFFLGAILVYLEVYLQAARLNSADDYSALTAALKDIRVSSFGRRKG